MKRVKVEGDYFHPRVPEDAIYVGRAAPGLKASKYANPHPVKRYGLDDSLQRYRKHLDEHPELVEAARAELATG